MYRLWNKATYVYKVWGRGLLFGIFEQGLLSGMSFVVTVILARVLGATEFGWFSVVWAFVIFLEAVGNGLFGDSIPSLAMRLSRGLWPEFRASLVLATLTLISVLCFVLWGSGIVLHALGMQYPGSAGAAILFFGVQRAQNLIRRILYLDGFRGLAALSACVNVTITFVCMYAFHQMDRLSASSAFLSLSFGCLGALSVAFSYFKAYAWPRKRLFYWAVRNLWKKGRWTMTSAAMSWIGNMGVIPFAAVLISPVAGGAIRAIQTMVIPLVQVNQILISLLVPKVAAYVRMKSRHEVQLAAVKIITLFLIIGIVYAMMITIEGEFLFERMFHFERGNVTILMIITAVVGYAIEGVRYGCNIMLFSVGNTSVVGKGQLISMLGAIFLIPSLGIYFGLTGLILGMALANNINTLYVAFRFFRGNFLPERALPR